MNESLQAAQPRVSVNTSNFVDDAEDASSTWGQASPCEAWLWAPTNGSPSHTSCGLMALSIRGRIEAGHERSGTTKAR
jgi:hypothetical protein